MSRDAHLESVFDSILNENNGVTTNYDRQKSRDEETLYHILDNMSVESLDKTKKKLDQLIEKKSAKQKVEQQEDPMAQEMLYNSIDSLL